MYLIIARGHEGKLNALMATIEIFINRFGFLRVALFVFNVFGGTQN